MDEETCRVEEDVEVGDEEDDALVLVADVDDDVAVGVGVAADAVVSVADAAWWPLGDSGKTLFLSKNKIFNCIGQSWES